mgnify:CR=1 FL=1
MSALRYLLDEHVDVRLRKAVKQRAPDLVIWHVDDVGAPRAGSSDPKILEWCEGNGFSLVTNNRASMPGHLRDHLRAGRHMPGIFVLDPDASLWETAQELLLIWGASDTEEYVDQLNYLPISR